MDQKKKLKKLARELGYSVRKGKDFQIFFGAVHGKKLINTDPNRGPRVWEWRMLHELGHAELMARREKNHVNTFYRLYRIALEEYYPTEAFYREYLDMEWKAWAQGAKIAKREGIKINEKQYWRHAKKCWYTYVTGLRGAFS